MDNKNKNDIRKRLEELAKEQDKKNGKRPPKMTSSMVFLTVILMTFAFMFSGRVQEYFQERKEITYSQFMNKISDGTFKEIIEKDSEIISKKVEGKKEIIYTTRKITDRIGDDENLLKLIEEKKANLVVSKPSSSGLFWYAVMNIVPYLLMIGVSIYLFRRISGNGQGGPGGIFGFGKSRADKLEKKPNVKFEDVAGVDGAKEELREIVDFLKDPTKYTKAGARVPRGVLLLGRPGTGKTLLAKAVAGESGASFFSLSGSDFVEMFVGVGASRVRDLFEKAKENAPSIIFIDEIDAIGRKRSSGRNSGSNDEREQTLNQLLVEMDGFETDTKVIVIAATNREDILDSALLRAGRFDRRVTVDAPDVEGRVAILKVHSKGKKLADDVKLEDIAKITPGFVGADLANLLNEAAILAARKGNDTITMADLDEAVDKIGMGLGQKGKIIKPEEKKLLAYHEAGHAVMTELTEGADPVHKVTIIPRGGAGGYMMPLVEEKMVLTKKQILAEIKVLFAGRAAEEIVLDDISTGASNDIERATKYARYYVERVGMSKELGPVNLANSEEEFSFVASKSDETAREVDLEIRKILKDEYQNTINTLTENREKLDKVANLLLKKETITGEEVRKLINGATVEEIMGEVENKEEKVEVEAVETKEIKENEISENLNEETKIDDIKIENIEKENIGTEVKDIKIETNKDEVEESNV